MTQPPKPESNGLAIASLVLGILSVTSFSILTGIPALVTGIIGLKQGQDKGMSLAGVIMGGISIVLAVLFVLFFVLVIVLGIFAADSSSSQFDEYDSTPQDDSSLFRQRT